MEIRMQIKLGFLLSVVFICGLLVHVGTVHAQNTEEFKIINNSTLKANKSASKLNISHNVSVTNQSAESLKSLDFALPVSKANNITVTYSDGTEIPFSKASKRSRVANREFEHTSVILDFPKNVNGTGNSWGFTIRYTTPERIHARGGNVTLIVPLLDGGVANGWSATVSVPNSFANINYHPPASGVSHQNNRQEFVFKKKDIKQNVLGLSFSDSQIYTLDLNSELRNTSLFPKMVSLNLPLDLHNQSAFIENITPQPEEIRVDADGNIIARYRLWPFDRKRVSITAATRVKQLRYDPSKAKSASKTPEQLQTYVESGTYWPTQGTVAEKAREITKKEKNAWENTRRLHNYVRDKIAFKQTDGKRVPANEVLEDKTGNKYNTADLLISMLRSQDIPARLIEGFIYPSSGITEEKQVHAWVEAYINDVGWVTLDPAWSKIFGSFGYSSADRIAMKAVSNDSQYQNFYPLKSTVFDSEIRKELPKKETGQVNASATRYTILPGVVYDERKVRNTSGYVIDDAKVSGVFEGSLAPHAELTNGQWNLAGFSRFSVEQSVGEKEPAATTSDFKWWPLVVTALLIIAGGVIQFYQYRSKKYVRSRLGE